MSLRNLIIAAITMIARTNLASVKLRPSMYFAAGVMLWFCPMMMRNSSAAHMPNTISVSARNSVRFCLNEPRGK